MELNIVGELEKHRKEFEKFSEVVLTDLNTEWNGNEKKLSFTHNLFNGAPIPQRVTLVSVLCDRFKASWDCDESRLNKEYISKLIFIVEVKKSSDEGDKWKQVFSGKDKICIVDRLDSDTKYDIRVKSAIGDVHGVWSDTVRWKTQKITGINVNVNNDDITWDSVIFKWDAGENVPFYQFELGSGDKTIKDLTENNSFKAENLFPDTEYTFRVRTVKGKELSGWSELAKVRTKKFIIDSSILSQEKNRVLFKDKIFEWCGLNNFDLLYRGTRDGFNANNFHNMCDNQNKTLVLIKNNSGHVFGGFASTSWTRPSSSSTKQAPGSFLFTLTNTRGIEPTRFPLSNENNNAVYHSSGCGPIFGNGSYDIYISTNCDCCSSSTNFPSMYKDTSGRGIDKTIFTSNKNNTVNCFVVEEIEVFKAH